LESDLEEKNQYPKTEISKKTTVTIYLFSSRKSARYIRGKYRYVVNGETCVLNLKSVNAVNDGVENPNCPFVVLYNNLTAKVYCAMKDFVDNENSNFFMKLDDDVIINFEEFCQFMMDLPARYPNSTKLLIGNLFIGQPILHPIEHKGYKNMDILDWEWGERNGNRTTYPPYVSGIAEVISEELVKEIEPIWKNDQNHFFKKTNDDATVGMTLFDHKIGFDIVELSRIRSYPDDMNSNFMAYHSTWNAGEQKMNLICDKQLQFENRTKTL